MDFSDKQIDYILNFGRLYLKLFPNSKVHEYLKELEYLDRKVAGKKYFNICLLIFRQACEQIERDIPTTDTEFEAFVGEFCLKFHSSTASSEPVIIKSGLPKVKKTEISFYILVTAFIFGRWLIDIQEEFTFSEWAIPLLIFWNGLIFICFRLFSWNFPTFGSHPKIST